MTYRGHVKNGQITLDEPATLPEGADVQVEVLGGPPAASDSARQLAALEAFADAMTKLTEHLPPGHVVDDSRETIYEGRGG
jgi:hypothetical protein